MGIRTAIKPLGAGSSMKVGKIIVNSSGGGVGSFKLKRDAICRIFLTGSGGYGGGRANHWSYAGGGGGSGAHLVVDVLLKKGTYFYYGANSVADPNSPEGYTSDGAWFSPQSVFSSETVYFHAGGGTKPNWQGGGGAGGTSFIIKNPFGYMKIIKQINGNPGTKATAASGTGYGQGGASVDPEYGKGGQGAGVAYNNIGNPGNPGRITIMYLGR